MIDRPNWTPGMFDSKGNEIAPAAPSLEQQVIHEMQTQDGPSEATKRALAEPCSFVDGITLPWRSKPRSTGLSVVAGTGDLGRCRLHHGQLRLQDMPPNFVAHFETLSPGIQTKAFRALKAYPHLDVYGLIDKVQPTLTLSEMAEAQAWIKGLKR